MPVTRFSHNASHTFQSQCQSHVSVAMPVTRFSHNASHTFQSQCQSHVSVTMQVTHFSHNSNYMFHIHISVPLCIPTQGVLICLVWF